MLTYGPGMNVARALAETRLPVCVVNTQPVGEVSIEVPCGSDTDDASDELLAQTEHMIQSLGAPFVPQKHEGVIYIRPPVS